MKRALESRHFVESAGLEWHLRGRPEPQVHAGLEPARFDARLRALDVQRSDVEARDFLDAEVLDPEKVLLGEAESDVEQMVVGAEMRRFTEGARHRGRGVGVTARRLPVPQVEPE